MSSSLDDWKLKRLIKYLKSIEGSGTSFVTLIIPPNSQISLFNQLLTDEFGTASNIKSRVNRQSVLSAITYAQQKLKLYNRIPNNGLVIYSGETDSTKISIDLEPPKPINASQYICDKYFHTEILEELLESDKTYGFIIVDGNGCLFGTLSGNTPKIISHFDVHLPGKTRRGGQSAARFGRLREEKYHNYLRKVAENAVQIFITNDKVNVSGIVLAGVAAIKIELSKSDLFDSRLQSKVISVLDIAYGGLNGFNQAIDLAAPLLEGVRLVHEKKVLQKFFDTLRDNASLNLLGLNEVQKSYDSGAIDTLILWDGLPSEILEPFIETYKNYGIILELISDQSSEGNQFVKGFGGIGAILRYPLTNDDQEQGADDDDQNEWID